MTEKEIKSLAYRYLPKIDVDLTYVATLLFDDIKDEDSLIVFLSNVEAYTVSMEYFDEIMSFEYNGEYVYIISDEQYHLSLKQAAEGLYKITLNNINYREPEIMPFIDTDGLKEYLYKKVYTDEEYLAYEIQIESGKYWWMKD